MPEQQIDPSPYINNMQGAIAAYKSAGSPSAQLPQLQQVLTANYAKVLPTGYFQSGDGQQLGHILRGAWGVEDPTQGGTVTPTPQQAFDALPPEQKVLAVDNHAASGVMGMMGDMESYEDANPRQFLPQPSPIQRQVAPQAPKPAIFDKAAQALRQSNVPWASMTPAQRMAAMGSKAVAAPVYTPAVQAALHRPAPARNIVAEPSGNWFTNTLIPDAKGFVQSLANTALNITGNDPRQWMQPTAQQGGALAMQSQRNEIAKQVKGLAPSALMQQPVIGNAVRGGLGVLRLMDADSAAPNPGGQMVATAVKGIGHDFATKPIESTANVLPFVAPYLHGLIPGVKVPAVESPADIVADAANAQRPPAMQPAMSRPAKPMARPSVALHPAAPGENGAARAVDGTFASPAEVAQSGGLGATFPAAPSPLPSVEPMPIGVGAVSRPMPAPVRAAAPPAPLKFGQLDIPALTPKKVIAAANPAPLADRIAAKMAADEPMTQNAETPAANPPPASGNEPSISIGDRVAFHNPTENRLMLGDVKRVVGDRAIISAFSSDKMRGFAPGDYMMPLADLQKQEMPNAADVPAAPKAAEPLPVPEPAALPPVEKSAAPDVVVRAQKAGYDAVQFDGANVGTIVINKDAFETRPHSAIVQQAIAEGKPIPPEVLADYPELKPKPAVKTLPPGDDSGAVAPAPQVPAKLDKAAKLDATAQAAAKRIAARNKGRLAAGIDPEDIRDLAIYGAAKIAQGVVTFADFSAHMIETFGKAISPYLEEVYHHAQAVHEKVFGDAKAEDEATATASGAAKPAVEEPAKPPKAAASGKYIGSINRTKMTGTPEENAAIEESIVKQGLDKKAPVSNEQRIANAQKLGVTLDTLRTMEPGQHPPGLNAGEQSAYVTSVREAAQSASKSLTGARVDYERDPSPENEAAMKKASDDLDMAIRHRDAFAHSAGQVLQAHNEGDDAYMADTADERMAKQKAVAEVKEILSKTRSMRKPSDQGGAESPRAARNLSEAERAAKHKVFTLDARNAAKARLNQTLSGLNSIADPIALAPAFKDLVIIGGYHVEDGLLRFGEWASAMAKDVPQFAKMSAADQQRVYANSRAEYIKQSKPRVKSAAQVVLADALRPTLAAKGVSDFFDSLANHPDHPDLLAKLIADEKLTPEERQIVNADYGAAKAPRKASAKPPAQESLSLLNDIRKEFAVAHRASSSRLKGATARGAKPKMPMDAVKAGLARRVGKNADALMSALNAAPETAKVIGKLRANESLSTPEYMGAARIMEDYLPNRKVAKPTDVSKVLTQAIKDARDGALARTPFDAKQFVIDRLSEVAPESDHAQIVKEVADVPTDAKGEVDGGKLNTVMRKWSEHSFASNMSQAVRAGMLSSPSTLAKIFGSHFLYTLAENAGRPIGKAALSLVGKGHLATGIDLGADAGAMRSLVARGLPESARIIKEGQLGMALRGRDPLFTPGAAAHLPAEFHIAGDNKLAQGVAAGVRSVNRLHSALYHGPMVAFMERGVREGAAIKAQMDAKAAHLTGAKYREYVKDKSAEYYAAPPQDVLEHAQAFVREEMFLNQNKFTNGLKSFYGGLERPLADEKLGLGLQRDKYGKPLPRANNMAEAVKILEAEFTPFTTVPSNVVGKMAEYTGGAVYAPVAALVKKLVNGSVSDQEAMMLAKTFQRGIVGAGAMGTGYALAKHFMLNPPDPKKGEYGSLNVPHDARWIFGKKMSVGNLQPIASPLLMGAEYAKTQGSGKAKTEAAIGTGFEGIEEIPTSRLAEYSTWLMSGTPYEWKKAVGTILASNVPAGLNFIAKATDKAPYRRKTEIMDYVKARIPGLREELPSTKARASDQYKVKGIGGVHGLSYFEKLR